VTRQEGEDASDEITEVASGILRLQLPIRFTGLGHVNTYALEDANGFAVVDPGLPGEESWLALQGRLDAAEIPLARIHTVLVTHSHPDHFGGAGLLAEVSGARVVASEHFRLWWRGDEGGEVELESAGSAPVSPLLERTTPWGSPVLGDMTEEQRARIEAMQADAMRWFRTPRVTRSLADADRISLAGRDWVAMHTPGHTFDHLCLFDPADGVLLSGDHVLPTITPHISGLFEGDPLAQYVASLHRVASLEGVTRVLPAHGHPFTDLPGRVDAITQHHDERLATLRAISTEMGWADVVELSHRLFSPRSWGSMAESETYAHLEHLRIAGFAELRRENGELRYLVTG
jgi:glyoxylase-like metal-dependent hydrolase (beta-lactamase superfamily II)